MTLETIYYIGQTIAVVVIIATLAAVLMQSRQANKIARAELTRAQLSDAATTIESIYNSPKLVEILIKVDGRENLTPSELFQFSYYMFSWWNNLQGAHNLKNKGLMEPESYKQLLNAGKFLYRSNLTHGVWKANRDLFPNEFAKEIDAVFKLELGRKSAFGKGPDS